MNDDPPLEYAGGRLRHPRRFVIVLAVYVGVVALVVGFVYTWAAT